MFCVCVSLIMNSVTHTGQLASRLHLQDSTLRVSAGPWRPSPSNVKLTFMMREPRQRAGQSMFALWMRLLKVHIMIDHFVLPNESGQLL